MKLLVIDRVLWPCLVSLPVHLSSFISPVLHSQVCLYWPLSSSRLLVRWFSLLQPLCPRDLVFRPHPACHTSQRPLLASGIRESTCTAQNRTFVSFRAYPFDRPLLQWLSAVFSAQIPCFTLGERAPFFSVGPYSQQLGKTPPILLFKEGLVCNPSLAN